MTKELLIAQLRLGTDGNSILQILDALCSGMDSSESSQDNGPTLDEIQFQKLDEMCHIIQWHINLDEMHTINQITHIEIMKLATVTPISRKAKNRFANLMGSDAQCIIEQHIGNRVFLTSMNGRNHFWVTLDKDADWMVQL